jgi:hypothetical protein
MRHQPKARLTNVRAHLAMVIIRAAVGAACMGGASALLGACGDGDPPSDVAVDPCEPHLGNWVPQWTQPRAPDASACTAQQVDLEYDVCEAATANPGACRQFRDDPANRNCEACLFSDAKEASYGPIVLDDDRWKTNTAGCIAILDDDIAGQVCGAKVQAASTCYDVACAGCQPFDAFIACRQRAIDSVCRPYYLDSVCIARPKYAICTEYGTSRDYFRSAGKFFCSGATSINEEKAGDNR